MLSVDYSNFDSDGRRHGATDPSNNSASYRAKLMSVEIGYEVENVAGHDGARPSELIFEIIDADGNPVYSHEIPFTPKTSVTGTSGHYKYKVPYYRFRKKPIIESGQRIRIIAAFVRGDGIAHNTRVSIEGKAHFRET